MKIKAKLERALRLLRELEFCGTPHEGGYCYNCWGVNTRGIESEGKHTATCELAKLIEGKRNNE